CAHAWSPLASANASIVACGISIQLEGPNVAPGWRSVAIAPRYDTHGSRVSRSGRDRLRRLLDGLVRLFVREAAGARDERRAKTLRDRLLRDHALRHVAARGQLEHH